MEREHHHDQPTPQSDDNPAQLPAELVAAIQQLPYACVTAPTEQGPVFVVKAPGDDIERLRGNLPILLRHELYTHPAAPVIRTVLLLYDDLRRPLALESFINAGDPPQRDDFAALATQRELELLFYDEALTHRLSKRVRNGARELVPQILEQAERHLARIPRERRDFNRAKAAVMRAVEWPPPG